MEMKVEMKNAKPETEIGIAQSDSNPCIETTSKSNSDLGAGANAGSRVDTKFATSDPLSELVWSPQNGLSLRCTDCSIKQPSLNFWAAGPSNTAIIRSTNINETMDENYSLAQNYDLVNRASERGVCGLAVEMNTATCLSIQRNNENDTSSDHKIIYDPIRAKVAEVGDDKFQRSIDYPKFIREPVEVLSENRTSRMEISGNPDLRPKNKPKTCKKPGLFLDKANEICPLNAVPLDRFESMDENELGFSCEIKKNYDLCEKGKEKALSEGDRDGRKSNEDDEESYTSVESCNSAGFSRGRKRSNFEQILLSGTKRIKGRIQENQEFGSKMKQDSSFMNWISNMTKGFWNSNQGEAPSLALSVMHVNNRGDEISDQNVGTSQRNQDSEYRSIGFQSIFRSIYCSNRRIQEAPRETKHQDEDEVADMNDVSLSCYGKNRNFQTHDDSTSGDEATRAAETKILSVKAACIQANKTESLENKNSCNLMSFKEKEGMISSSGKIDFPGKLWITRFRSRNSGLSSKNRYDTDTDEAIGDCVKPVREGDELATITGGSGYGDPRLKSTDAMASLFARRLDAIKHITPSGVPGTASGAENMTCLSTMRRDSGIEEHSSTVHGKESAGLSLGVKESDKHRVMEISSSVSKENLDVPKGIFNAVRVLRLSRTNILKWMNSKGSLSNLEGFFVRLRLAKCGERLGGTGYYVACITGPGWDEFSPSRSKNSISVTVGGINCLVESQYISNHDFLQDEVKAWWRAKTRHGGGLPSEEDLRLKMEEKKMLGF